jgi:hypothetical protein
MLPTYCPQCRAIRQPNGQFCHACGYSFVERRAAEVPAAALARTDVGLSMGDGFRFGIGFMVAVIVFSLVATVLSTVFFAGLLGALLRSFAS